MKNHLLYLNSSERSYQCHCGCNVFHRPDEDKLDIYQCNGCGSQYSKAGTPLVPYTQQKEDA